MPAFGYLATANDTYSLGANARLISINVGTAAASAVVTVYNGTSTSDPVVDTIDASAVKDLDFHSVRLSGGLFVKLTGGNAKVTVIAE